MITANDVWNRIFSIRGELFRVVFRTKTSQHRMNPDGTRTSEIISGPGRTRSMLCRRLVQKFALGVIPPAVRLAEDVENNVLTVWDIETFRMLRIHLEDQGMKPFEALMTAGRRSYRRINMAEILSISIPPAEIA